MGYTAPKDAFRRLTACVGAAEISEGRFRLLLEAARGIRDPFLSKQVMDAGSLANNWGKIVAAIGQMQTVQEGGF